MGVFSNVSCDQGCLNDNQKIAFDGEPKRRRRPRGLVLMCFTGLNIVSWFGSFLLLIWVIAGSFGSGGWREGEQQHQQHLQHYFPSVGFVGAHEVFISSHSEEDPELSIATSWTGRVADEPAAAAFLSEEERIKQVIEEDKPELSWKITAGWTLPENNVYRNYLCRFGDIDVPCWDEIGLFHEQKYGGWPMPIYCPPSQCCGDQDQGVRCRMTCGGGGWSSMAGGECVCSKHQHKCPKNTVCDDSDRGKYGGAYCKCKEGYVGDGFTCHPDPCANKSTNKCAPGQCKGRPNGDAYCICPTGYTWDGSDPKLPRCVLANTCEGDPCGPSEAVLQCRTDKALEYTCVCRPGYALGTVDGKKRCVPFDGRSKCQDEPCGTVGLLSCTDTPTGAECICQKHHRLVTQKRRKACIYSPCEDEPCGNTNAVKTCTAGIASYTCICNANYRLDTEDGMPVCVKAIESYTLLLVGLGLVGLGLVVAVISCFILRRRMLQRTALESFEQQGLQNTMGALQDGIGASSSQWM